MKYQLIQGDNRVALKTLPDNSIDAIVTDPPYGIDFLGKAWDANIGALETYQECLRVLKPGGHILAFSAARTYHHLAITLEQAGFEIRDQIMWLYSTGFPKSQNIGRAIQKRLGVKKTKKHKTNQPSIGGRGEHVIQKDNEQIVITDPEAKKWEGWGTALKPAHEPICLARKPVRGSIKDTVQRWGTGALNIDATRIPYVDEKDRKSAEGFKGLGGNVVFDNFNPENRNKIYHKDEKITKTDDQGRFPSNVIGEIPDYQKYFYCPKVSRRERHLGFDNLPKRLCGPGGDKFVQAQDHQRSNNDTGNNHPTVKPVELMKYLIKLITPPGGTVLDPFNGSGSTGVAAVGLGFNYIGCELDPRYIEISKKRIDAWVESQEQESTKFQDLFDEDAT
jgi:DNA modification methylase